MVREAIGTGKTTADAIAAACRELGVREDDLNVSVEILEMPAWHFFKKTPARVKVTVTAEEEAAPAVPVPVKEKQPGPKAAPDPIPVQEQAEAPKQPAAAMAPEKALGEGHAAKVEAASAYLREVFEAMGVTDCTLETVEQDGATVLRVDGEGVSTLIGRRGETMEALSHLAGLVANRAEGDYIKLGLDVAGYRGRRANDLETLARRLADRVIRTGHRFEMEPMNPYERRIIHSAIGRMEGVRSESSGEGLDRHVVIYSTDPAASNTAERSPSGRSGSFRRGDRSRNGRGPRREGSHDSFRRGARPARGSRPPRPSGAPERNFTEVRPEDARPTAPKRLERVDDVAGTELFGKIEL